MSDLKAIAANVRPLGIALAHAMRRCKLPRDVERLTLLNKIYTASKPVDKMRCRSELVACRAGARGEVLAEVR